MVNWRFTVTLVGVLLVLLVGVYNFAPAAFLLTVSSVVVGFISGYWYKSKQPK